MTKAKVRLVVGIISTILISIGIVDYLDSAKYDSAFIMFIFGLCSSYIGWTGYYKLPD